MYESYRESDPVPCTVFKRLQTYTITNREEFVLFFCFRSFNTLMFYCLLIHIRGWDLNAPGTDNSGPMPVTLWVEILISAS